MLRPEILRFPRADGTVELYDPVLDRVHALGPGEATPATLEEGPLADTLRAQWWARKRATVPPAPAMAPPESAEWNATDLPETIGAMWRDGESWRRLAEDRAAGATGLPMPGLLAPAFARALAEAHRGLDYERMASGITFADRHVCTRADRGPVAEWLAVMASSTFRALMGAVFGLPLPEKVTANAWRMDPGDEIRAHPVGTTYMATLSLGLNPGWTAADHGAIAFADAGPDDARFQVRARWLPQLGDGLAIARGPASWHWVEPPRRERRTLTGWWVLQ